MTDVLRYRSPREGPDNTANLGMLIFLASWAMMFAALFFAYGAVRFHAIQWPPPGVAGLPRDLPFVNTVLIVASSVTMQLGVSRIEKGKPLELSAALLVTLLLGLLFTALQFVLWRRIWLSGLRPDSGTYGSVFYALTVFHCLHVLVGLGALAALLGRSLQGHYSAPRHLAVKLWAMYWHFVDAVWLVIFVSVFLV